MELSPLNIFPEPTHPEVCHQRGCWRDTAGGKGFAAWVRWARLAPARVRTAFSHVHLSVCSFSMLSAQLCSAQWPGASAGLPSGGYVAEWLCLLQNSQPGAFGTRQLPRHLFLMQGDTMVSPSRLYSDRFGNILGETITLRSL